jgi:hypothetical protein
MKWNEEDRSLHGVMWLGPARNLQASNHQPRWRRSWSWRFLKAFSFLVTAQRLEPLPKVRNRAEQENRQC